MSDENAVDCPLCGGRPDIEPCCGGYMVTCSNCYDGAPDSSMRSFYGFGGSLVGAKLNWNEECEERMLEAADKAGEDQVR